MKKFIGLLIAAFMLTPTTVFAGETDMVIEENVADEEKDEIIVEENMAYEEKEEIIVEEKKDEKREVIEDVKKNTSVPEEINGWVYSGNAWYYYSSNIPYTGWHYMSAAEGEKTPHWSYFGKDGTIYTGWRKMGKKEGEKTEHLSYFGSNGWLRTGWQKLGKADGEKTEHWSFFGNNGWLVTGWKYMDKSQGEKTPHWSYFGSNGWLVTGWKYMDKSQGEKTPHWSYFGPNGWMRTGIVTLGKADGEKVTHKSFFGSNGWLVVNKVLTINKEQYIADGKGWLTLAKTEHEKTLARAMELVAKVTNDSMSMEQKLRACYIHIRDGYPEYNPRIPHFAGQGWHLTYANDIFVGKDGRKGGNCISVGAALAYMAKAIGFENVYAVNGTGHGWAEVNNKVYDAEWERHNKGSFYAVSYDDSVGKPKYKWIFASSNPYARIRL